MEAALASDRAAALIVEGLRRDVIAKMELRDLAVLDEFQDEMFRLPINSRLVILGPPGTGKTTTLIKRLAQKRDLDALTADERDAASNALAGVSRHSESWIMFTPTSLLKQYVKEAFARENIAAPDDRIQTWDDYRREIARNRFGILRSPSGGGPFIVKDHLPSLQPATVADQREWFADFDAWQSSAFWMELQTHAQSLANNKETAIARLGARIQSVLPSAVSGLHVSAFPRLAILQKICRR